MHRRTCHAPACGANRECGRSALVVIESPAFAIMIPATAIADADVELSNKLEVCRQKTPHYRSCYAVQSLYR